MKVNMLWCRMICQERSIFLNLNFCFNRRFLQREAGVNTFFLSGPPSVCQIIWWGEHSVIFSGGGGGGSRLHGSANKH